MLDCLAVPITAIELQTRAVNGWDRRPPMVNDSSLSALEIQALRVCCRAAAAYHDSPATKGHLCLPWVFCGCERAKQIREADVAICRLEWRPAKPSQIRKPSSTEARP